MAAIVDSKRFKSFITAMIIFNGITLGLMTSKSVMEQFGPLLIFLDVVVIGIFTIEIAMRIYVHRKEFFKDPWSLFDFFVVAISLVPASEEFSILRVLRVLRLFRLLTIVPQMRKIIGALVSVIPGIGSVAMVLLLIFYVFSIMATSMYGEAFPQWFGTLGASMYTLFQVMTLESWSMGIARPVMEQFPGAWLFFVIFVLISTFVMVNLLIGIIVDAIFAIKDEEKPEKRAVDEKEELKRELEELKAALSRVQKRLE
ncbi:voltage-gated sodium channel subunit [Hydrogenimonas sp.]|nr:voltage-gated sodium channel subunit [Hydrogenimonas sp.]